MLYPVELLGQLDKGRSKKVNAKRVIKTKSFRRLTEASLQKTPGEKTDLIFDDFCGFNFFAIEHLQEINALI